MPYTRQSSRGPGKDRMRIEDASCVDHDHTYLRDAFLFSLLYLSLRFFFSFFSLPCVLLFLILFASKNFVWMLSLLLINVKQVDPFLNWQNSDDNKASTIELCVTSNSTPGERRESSPCGQQWPRPGENLNLGVFFGIFFLFLCLLFHSFVNSTTHNTYTSIQHSIHELLFVLFSLCFHLVLALLFSPHCFCFCVQSLWWTICTSPLDSLKQND